MQKKNIIKQRNLEKAIVKACHNTEGKVVCVNQWSELCEDLRGVEVQIHSFSMSSLDVANVSLRPL